MRIFLRVLKRLRGSGCGIVWTVHNLANHEARHPRLDRACTQRVIRAAGGMIVHCDSAVGELRSAYAVPAGADIRVIPHGHYTDAYASNIDRGEARRRLGLPAEGVVFLFLGHIRPYKGVLELVTAFRSLPHASLRLVIAGKPLDAEAERAVTADCEGDERIMLRCGFVPDSEVQVFMNAADAVVLPYRDVLTSGAAVLAMSFGKACIGPRIGCLRDLLTEAGAISYDGADADGLRTALEAAVERHGALASMGEHNRTVAAAWHWEGVAKQTARLYRDVTSANRP